MQGRPPANCTDNPNANRFHLEATTIMVPNDTNKGRRNADGAAVSDTEYAFGISAGRGRGTETPRKIIYIEGHTERNNLWHCTPIARAATSERTWQGRRAPGQVTTPGNRGAARAAPWLKEAHHAQHTHTHTHTLDRRGTFVPTTSHCAQHRGIPPNCNRQVVSTRTSAHTSAGCCW